MYFNQVISAFKNEMDNMADKENKKPAVDPSQFALQMTKLAAINNHPFVPYYHVRRGRTEDFQRKQYDSPKKDLLDIYDEYLYGPKKKKLKCSALQEKYDKLLNEINRVVQIDKKLAIIFEKPRLGVKRRRSLGSLGSESLEALGLKEWRKKNW